MNEKEGSLQQHLSHLNVIQDTELRALWIELKHNQGRPCMTPELLEELQAVRRLIQIKVQEEYEQNQPARLLYQVLTSSDKRAFSLGADLNYLIEKIEAGDRESILRYARTFVDFQFSSIRHYDVPFTTIALIQGEALGSGFEIALASNVVVAEESAHFGFPELSFGMGPGPGVISLLTQKISPAMARRMITDRWVHTARELYDMGIVDLLAADGEGRETVVDYMQRHRAISPGQHYLQATIDRAIPISYEELSYIAEDWVDATLQISENNRCLMKSFARAQSKRQGVHPV